MSLRASYALIFLWPMLSKVEGFQQNRPQGALLWQAQRPTRALLLRDQTTLSYHRPGHIRRCSGGYTRFYSSASPDDPAQEEGEEGEFRIQPKDAVDAFLGVADDVDPAFQGRRRSPAPLSDNVTVLSRTETRAANRRSKPTSARWYKEKQSFLSPRQRRLIRQLFPKYGQVLRFGEAPLSVPPSSRAILEIGFGNGYSLLHHLKTDPSCYVIGCEFLQAGIAQVLEGLVNNSISPERVKIVRCDVALLLQRHLIDSCLDEAYILFPDPWPSPSDHCRRVVRADLVELLAAKLKPGGKLRVATDVADYAEWVWSVMGAQEVGVWDRSSFRRLESAPLEGPTYRATTRYEERALTLGHSVWDFEFAKCA